MTNERKTITGTWTTPDGKTYPGTLTFGGPDEPEGGPMRPAVIGTRTFIVAPGECLEIGDWVTIDKATWKVRKAVSGVDAENRFTIPPGTVQRESVLAIPVSSGMAADLPRGLTKL